MEKKDLLKHVRDKYYYQVDGKHSNRPNGRVVKDRPIYPELIGDLECIVKWRFGVFGGEKPITLTNTTTLTDVLKAIERDAMMFNYTTIVREATFDPVMCLIVIVFTEIWARS